MYTRKVEYWYRDWSFPKLVIYKIVTISGSSTLRFRNALRITFIAFPIDHFRMKHNSNIPN